MQISTKFTTAVHVLIAIEYFRDDEKITSDMLAGTVGSNPVIIRNIMSQLKEAGLIEVRRGPGGITLLKPLEAITFLDLYRAVETGSSAPLFTFMSTRTPRVRSDALFTGVWTRRWMPFRRPLKLS